MDNKKIKSINKKLIIILVIMLAILGTLLATKVDANRVSAEIESTKQMDRANPTWFSYSDLVDFYDILCCQHGAPLKGTKSTILKGSYGGTSFYELLGELKASDKGTQKYNHKLYYQGSDFSSSTYTHFTYGYYTIVEQHIATPKEAYIIAEMRKESEISSNETSYEVQTDQDGSRREYTGGLSQSDSIQLSTGETAYIINQTYALDNGNGIYLVEKARDSQGNNYYVYKTDAQGNLIQYTGGLSYVDDRTGQTVNYNSANVDNVYYKFNGTLSKPGSKYPGSGKLYLVDYDTVVDLNGDLYQCELRGDYNYIQIAWWTTDIGTNHGTVAPSLPNGLAKEAEAFEAYILKITGKTNVNSLEYAKQKYEFTDENGTNYSGEIEAPVIEYNPEWNEDADQNGSINEMDEVTVAFDGNSQKYVVGPFSIDYVKKSVQVEGRNKVEFSSIYGAKLVSNLGELKLGTDWNFKWLTDQARDLSEGYNYPNPNEVFYIEINYKAGMTSINEFSFDFKYMNAGARLDIYDGKYNKCTWTVQYDDHHEPYDSDGDGINDTQVFSYRDIWLELTSMEPFDSQTLAHGLLGARWYNYKQIKKDWEISNYSYITIEKETVNANGDVIQIDGTFDFEIYVNDKLFQTLSVKTTEGRGLATSEKIIWEDGKAPSYKVVEVNYDEERYTPQGPWTGILENNDTITVKAKNIVDPYKGTLQIDKKLLNPTPAMEGEIFNFEVTLTGNFEYEGKEYNATASNPLIINVTLSSSTNWTWQSSEFKWHEEAPHYKVKEIIPEDAGYELVGEINQGNGYLENDQNKVAIATNKPDTEPEPLKGRLQIKKTYIDSNGNEIIGKTFYFRVTVGDETFDISIDSGSSWRSGYFYWEEDEEAPKYHVEEINIPEGCSVSIDNPDGQLEAQDTENGIQGIKFVNVTNTVKTNKESQIQINKELITNDKITESDITGTFTFKVNVTGTFTYKKVSYVDETMTLQVKVSKENNWTWESEKIYWYDKAPTYSVEEVELPSNWNLVSMSNSSGSLESGKTAIVDCTNEWKPIEEIILTMEIGGKVWDDTDRTMDKHVDAQENGIIDEGEAGIEKIKVNVYRVVTDGNGKTLARLQDVYAYDENNRAVRIDATTYTDSNGNWKMGAISVPAYKDDSEESSLKAKYGNNIKLGYDVEFEYDGQTYEPTTYLATAQKELGVNSTVEQRASSYRSKSTAERDKYLYDSMTIDNVNERISFNNSFENITGEEAIDGAGNTLGLATGSSGSKELHYSSVDSVSLFNSDNSRKVSTLETTDGNGYIYKELLMKARTSTAGLTYPFDNKIHLTHWDKELTDVFKVTYYYSATYNYCLSINLGLIEREAADSAIEKDLSTATVVVNGKVLKYKFNKAIDLDDPDNTELLYKQIAVADEQIEYNLGLYSSDYYYRAAVYNGTEVGDALDGFYTQKLNLPKKSTEMDIYLTYTVIVHNQSETYNLRINSLADYYDSSFELITDNSSYDKTHKYVQTVNGKTVDDVVQLAEGSKVTYYTSGNQVIGTDNVIWQDAGERTGSDDVKYTKMTTNSLANKVLASGETAEITVTFRVEKDNFDSAGVYDTIKLGEKHNVVEVASFTSFYSDESKNKWSKPGQIAGRVDEDSAPNNVNIENFNEKTYYEDDTDSAPIITISLYDEDRQIKGIVWDDAQTDAIEYGQTVGNGLYNPDEGDKVIAGLTTEVIEAISIPTDAKDSDGKTVYKEYEFAWPTDKPFEELGGKTIAELTGFKQSISTDVNGEYSFVSVPAGNYRVRFVYGDKVVATGKTGDEEVYSGQDYKSTAYQSGFDNDSDNNGYVDNEWHDLSNTQLESTRVSDARDNEARRLYISSKSEMLTYANSHILETADNKDANHIELFGNYKDATDKVAGDGYYMYTETAKINLAVENVYKISYITETIGGVDVGLIDGDITQGMVQTGTKDFSYVVENIDCGIEQRSPTKLNLDKQIKEIKLITSDNKVILDAIYDISYEIGTDGSVNSTVTLNESASTGIDKIASLNRNGSSQGYRYIMAEGGILQGTTISVKYQLTVFNVGETDRCAQILETLWQDVNNATSEEQINSILNSALKKVSTPYYTEAKGRVYSDGSNYVKSQFGTYFGSIYYLGKQGVGTRTDESIVKTKVHQIIDYVDTDVVFANIDNTSKDQSWLNTTIEYLIENKLIDPAIVQIVNKYGEITGDTRADREIVDGEKYSIIDKDYREYITEAQNNIITNIDNGIEDEMSTNPALVKNTLPYTANQNYDEATASISLVVTRFLSSETDAKDVDNLAEIIKVENTVGRRDFRSVAGNTNPYALDETTGDTIGEYQEAGKEPDSSATEVITLSPPTGLNAEESRTMQLILVILVATVIVAVGIVVIKKKVLIKK